MLTPDNRPAFVVGADAVVETTGWTSRRLAIGSFIENTLLCHSLDILIRKNVGGNHQKVCLSTFDSVGMKNAH